MVNTAVDKGTLFQHVTVTVNIDLDFELDLDGVKLNQGAKCYFVE